MELSRPLLAAGKSQGPQTHFFQVLDQHGLLLTLVPILLRELVLVIGGGENVIKTIYVKMFPMSPPSPPPHGLNLGDTGHTEGTLGTQKGDGKFLCGFSLERLTFQVCCWKFLFKALNQEANTHKQKATAAAAA